ncbi:MAG: phage tail tip lysozyme, partial [Candidatus Saccharimonadales bacterium]
MSGGSASGSISGSAACCGGSASTVSATITSHNVKDSYDFFVQNGFSPTQAAGIVGNLMLESGFNKTVNPTQLELVRGGGYGIAQFTPPTDMEKWVIAKGEDPDSLKGQLDYLLYSLNNTTYQGHSVVQDIKSATTIRQAVLAFQGNLLVGGSYRGYERPGDENGTVGQRTTNANNVLHQYGNGAVSGSSSSASTASSGGGASCSSGGSATLAGGLANPFPGGWKPGRLDMGYDGHFTGEIVSPCNGTMTYVDTDSNHGSNGGWEGAYYVVTCSSTIPGLPSSSFNFAEGTTPTVTQGQSVQAGQQIGRQGWTGYNEGPGGIEWGLAEASIPRQTVAAALGNSCSAGSQSRQMVLNFSKWVQ